jgi:hypothetical protein
VKITVHNKGKKIYIRVRHRDLYGDLSDNKIKEILFSTGINISKYSKTNGVAFKKDLAAPLVENYRNAIERAVLLVLYSKEPLTKENILRNLRDGYDGEKVLQINKNLKQEFEDFLQFRKSQIGQSTYNGYKALLYALKRFEKYDRNTLSVDSFSELIFEKFLQFCHLVLEHHDNHMSRNCSRLKQFLVWARPQYAWRFVKHESYKPEILYLCDEEFEKLKIANLPKASFMHKVRDLFIFCCVTGMSYKDSQDLESSNINHDIIDYKSVKTGSRAVTSLNKLAANIILKWGGTPPKISNQKYNIYLKVLFSYLEFERPVKVSITVFGKVYNTEYPLCDVVTSSIAKKTFLMLLLSKKVPIQDIMTMTGYSDYKWIQPYINVHREHMKKYKNIFY